MVNTKQLASMAVALGVASVGAMAGPPDAKTWWRGRYRVGLDVPSVVAPPPAFAPPRTLPPRPAFAPPSALSPPSAFAPPSALSPPVVYARPPNAYYPAPHRFWIPPHWQGRYWVRGHWS